MPPMQVDELHCRRCDGPNPGGALFCTGCGAPLSDAVAAPPPLAQRGPACPGCGAGNPPGSRFCVTCGVGLNERAPVGYAPVLAAAGVGGPTTLVQNIYVAAPPTPGTLPLLVRALWFLFVGLWAGQFWLMAAWLLNITLIGMPLGLWMLNCLPQVMTLRQQRRGLATPTLSSSAHFAVRAVYFVLIGWWLSLLWMQLAWLFAASMIGLPLAFLMFERVGAITTLADA